MSFVVSAPVVQKNDMMFVAFALLVVRKEGESQTNAHQPAQAQKVPMNFVINVAKGSRQGRFGMDVIDINVARGFVRSRLHHRLHQQCSKLTIARLHRVPVMMMMMMMIMKRCNSHNLLHLLIRSRGSPLDTQGVLSSWKCFSLIDSKNHSRLSFIIINESLSVYMMSSQVYQR